MEGIRTRNRDAMLDPEILDTVFNADLSLPGNDAATSVHRLWHGSGSAGKIRSAGYAPGARTATPRTAFSHDADVCLNELGRRLILQFNQS